MNLLFKTHFRKKKRTEKMYWLFSSFPLIDHVKILLNDILNKACLHDQPSSYAFLSSRQTSFGSRGDMLRLACHNTQQSPIIAPFFLAFYIFEYVYSSSFAILSQTLQVVNLKEYFFFLKETKLVLSSVEYQTRWTDSFSAFTITGSTVPARTTLGWMPIEWLVQNIVFEVIHSDGRLD